MATRSDYELSQEDRKRRIFSETFKQKKVQEIERKQTTISEVCKQYQVRHNNIYKWMEKYSKGYKKGVRLVVEAESDTKRIIDLQNKIAQLEQIVGQKQVLLDFQAKMIDLAEQTYGVNIKKKNRLDTIIYHWQNREKLAVSLAQFYKIIGFSKQNLHQAIARKMAYEEEKNYLIPMICNIRKDHPTLSLRAMYYKIKPTHFGRDAFELLCKQEGFSLVRKLNSIRTTNSFGVIRFGNSLENIQLKQINQAWSSDITYYELNNTFYYITFIIDCYSRLIVGHAVSQRLTTEQTTLPVLKMALKRRKHYIPEDMIFHSDGGGQYYDKAFLKLTEAYKMSNGMCAYAYENGKAERINGVIKNNYLVHRNIKSFSALEKEVDCSVSLYNNEKPHKALQYKTPIEYEKLNLALRQQNRPIVTKSFNA